VAAFHYMLYPITEESGREAWGPFAPAFEGPQGVFPPPLPKVDDRWLTLWADVAQASTSPVVRSRLHDLLWERRWGARPDIHARQAIDAYVALTGTSWTSVDRAFGLIRALELTRAVKDQERLATVLAACENGARESMIASSPEPGVALRLIRALIWLPPDLQPPSVDDLLAEAEEVYGADPYHFASIVDLKVSRSCDAAFVRQLRIQQVERWRQRAGGAASLLRFAHLQTALETARNNGLSDLADEIRRDMQKVDLGLKQVEAAVPISAEHVETVISTFVDTDDWQTSLRRFGVYGPPSGDVQKNIAAVQQQMRASPCSTWLRRRCWGRTTSPSESSHPRRITGT